MKRNEIRTEVEQIAVETASKHGVVLVDADLVKEAGQEFLKIAIDKQGGVTTEDCETVSRGVSRVLDELDLIPWQYTLEVSSPGLERVLRRDREFKHFAGRTVDITLYAPKDGKKRYTGLLRSFDEGIVTIEVEDGSTIAFPRETVAKARLVYERRR